MSDDKKIEFREGPGFGGRAKKVRFYPDKVLGGYVFTDDPEREPVPPTGGSSIRRADER